MKQVMDRKTSKLPQSVPEESDIQRMIDTNVGIGMQMQSLSDLEDSLDSDVKYTVARKISERRVLQLVEKMLERPLNTDTLIWHAEVRGRISERFRVTREIAGIKTWKERLFGQKTRIDSAIEKTSMRIEKLKQQGRK